MWTKSIEIKGCQQNKILLTSFYKAASYMKKIYVKYKILVNGLHTTTPYTMDGFTLKSSTFDKNMFNNKYDENKEGIDFNLNFYLESCFTDFEKLSYNYFESVNYEEIEVSSNLKNQYGKSIKDIC